MITSNKINNSLKRIVFFFVLVICVLQAVKLNSHKDPTIVGCSQEYLKFINLSPVYKDSTFNIYISQVESSNKIIFFKKDGISDRQLRSKFFLHIYPKDHRLLGEGQNLLTYDFRPKFFQCDLNGIKVYIAECDLPNIDINKINIGQYGYLGNNEISWRISAVLKSRHINEILQKNKESGIRNFM